MSSSRLNNSTPPRWDRARRRRRAAHAVAECARRPIEPFRRRSSTTSTAIRPEQSLDRALQPPACRACLRLAAQVERLQPQLERRQRRQARAVAQVEHLQLRRPSSDGSRRAAFAQVERQQRAVERRRRRAVRSRVCSSIWSSSDSSSASPEQPVRASAASSERRQPEVREQPITDCGSSPSRSGAQRSCCPSSMRRHRLLASFISVRPLPHSYPPSTRRLFAQQRAVTMRGSPARHKGRTATTRTRRPAPPGLGRARPAGPDPGRGVLFEEFISMQQVLVARINKPQLAHPPPARLREHWQARHILGDRELYELRGVQAICIWP